MPDAHKNFAVSAVATAPSPALSGTSLIVTAGEGARFPTPPFNTPVCPSGVNPTPGNAEIVRVTAIAGDTFTILRAQEGSTARSIIVGDQIDAAITGKTLTDMEAALLALQAGAILSGDAALTVNSTSQVTIAAATQFMVANAAGLLLPVAITSTAISAIPTAVSNPRLDQIVVDSLGAVTRIAGAESAGATLANRTGAGAVPATSRVLHDILVPAGGTGVIAANVRDRRPWARGGFSRIIRTVNAAGGNDYTSTNSTPTAIDATNLSVRMECSGAPVRLTLNCRAVAPAGGMAMSFFMDGAAADGYTGGIYLPASQAVNESPSQVVIPSAGSHLFQPAMAPVVNGQTATVTVGYSAAVPVYFTVEEIVRQNASNGTS